MLDDGNAWGNVLDKVKLGRGPTARALRNAARIRILTRRRSILIYFGSVFGAEMKRSFEKSRIFNGLHRVKQLHQARCVKSRVHLTYHIHS